MKSLSRQLRSYAAYHQSGRNRATHFFGVPLVTFSLFLVLSWFRFAAAPRWPLTPATVAYAAVFAYYLRLDWRIAFLQAPFTLTLLAAADRVALLPFGESVAIFAVAAALGSILQLVGHALEGNRPALMDNLAQVLNAPLFLTVEACEAIGLTSLLSHPEASAPTAAPINTSDSASVDDLTNSVANSAHEPSSPAPKSEPPA